MVASPNGTVATGIGASVTDASGNVWTIDVAGQVTVNGLVDTSTANVDELVYVNSEVWQKNADNQWYYRTSLFAPWSASTYGPPGADPPNINAPITSPNDTTITTGSTATIIDDSGNVWGLTNRGQVIVDGAVDPTTANVVELAIVSGTIWQENAAALWYSKTAPGLAWSGATIVDPLPITWVGGGNNEASNPADWSTDTVPLAGDTLQMSSGTMNLSGDALAGDTLNVNGTVEINTIGATTLDLSAGAAPGGRQIDINIETGGTLTLTASVSYSYLNISGGGTLSLVGTSVFGFYSAMISDDIVGTGTVDINGGSVSAATVEINGPVGSGPTFDISSSGPGDAGLQIDHPSSFQGSISLIAGGWLKFMGLHATSGESFGSSLELFNGSTLVDTIKFVSTPIVGDGSPLQLTQNSSGVALTLGNAYIPYDAFLPLITVTAPVIAGTVANEPIEAGGIISPFANTTITDNDFDTAAFSAAVTITHDGTPTDAVGLLTGPGLGKTGVGAYTVSASSLLLLQADIEGLKFATASVAAGQSTTANFELDVTDTNPNLTSKDTTTSVLIIGPTATPAAPAINGVIVSGTVAVGNVLAPFANITISDTNASPTDSATLVVTGGGTLNGTGIASSTAGTYTIAATSPTDLTTDLDSLTFTPPKLASGQTTNTSTISLTVADNALSASASTSIVETAPASPPPPPPPMGIAALDTTTGQSIIPAVQAYAGPVAGLTSEYITTTSDSLNITTTTPGWFIHTGNGNDAIAVAGGTNVVDGGGGSNFLTGGSGMDTFFVDDRSASADIWSTVSGFHVGDAATIWGVAPQDFSLTWVDGQGAAGYTGLTLHVTASGQPTASLTVAGYTSADLNDGRLSVSFGTVGGSAYMYVHGNS